MTSFMTSFNCSLIPLPNGCVLLSRDAVINYHVWQLLGVDMDSHGVRDVLLDQMLSANVSQRCGISSRNPLEVKYSRFD